MLPQAQKAPDSQELQTNIATSAIFRADLHIHTHFSDGAYSPSQVMHLAKTFCLQGLSITDHDTLKAYPLALACAKKMNLKLISGIELSTYFDHTPVHVLGYSFDLKHSGLINFCQKLSIARKQRNEKILAKLAQYNFHLNYHELSREFPQQILGRPHIAHLMLKKGYVSNVKQAFEHYLGDKSRCSVPLQRFSALEAIDVIKAAGGKAILAHPQLIKTKKKFRALLEFPFDGLEGYYSTLPLEKETPFLAAAQQKNWLITGGSDYHGPKQSPYIKIGSSWTEKNIFEKLYRLFLKNNFGA